jgi:hypothetical protein
MKRDLKPARPENTKEAHVREQICRIGHGVVRRKCREIGYEEEVEEQFNGIRFVSLGENELFMVGTLQRGLDEWRGLV